MRRVAVLFALTGCSSIFGLHEPTHGTVADGPAMDSADASDTGDGAMPDGSMCIGHGALTVCFDSLPVTTAQLATSIDTTNDSACSTSVHWLDASQPDACFIAGTDVVQSGTTTIIGSRPLVVIALANLQITGFLDASSHVSGITGPGADPMACTAFAAQPQPSNNGGGGGAGGSFISIGGAGGAGDNAITAPGGQPASTVTASTVLRGGCSGQAGVMGGGNGTGLPGKGGGAIYLAAGSQLTIQAGRVAVNGAGARAPQNRYGGSGGGAGGMIVLDAPTITMTNAFLSANGGGGSSGADGGTGNPGADPDPLDPTVAAPGGAPKGGAGGAGAAGMSAAGDGGDAGGGLNRGGGGGGGGVGVIYASRAVNGATVSPAITTLP